MKLDAETLEAAAQMLEQTAGNSLYQSAWRAAAKKIRRMKILNDSGQQISAESPRPV